MDVESLMQHFEGEATKKERNRLLALVREHVRRARPTPPLSCEELLAHTCRKAGLDDEAWRAADTVIEIFSAIVFGEKG